MVSFHKEKLSSENSQMTFLSLFLSLIKIPYGTLCKYTKHSDTLMKKH